ncbi:MAG: uroporphyrinogen-III synthase, partial [Actinomycetota bacterium]
MSDRPDPPADRRVLLCRRPHEADALVARLAEADVEVVLLPLQAPTAPPDGGAALAASLADRHDYQWLLVTSANAVGPLGQHGLGPPDPTPRPGSGPAATTARPGSGPAATTARPGSPDPAARPGAGPAATTAGPDAPDPAARPGAGAGSAPATARPDAPDPGVAPGAGSAPGWRVGAVGPATARALGELGIDVDVLPSQATAADLAAAVIEHDRAAGHEPGRVLAPLATAAGSDLTSGLAAAGYAVDRVDAYHMEPLQPDLAAIEQARSAAILIVTAPSVARRLSELGIGGGNPTPAVVAIGPRSAAAADAAG